MKKFITSVMFFALMLSLFCFNASAFELDTADASIGGYYLYNFENDMVMAEADTEKSISPSSTVKIMTACIALESGIPGDRVISVTGSMLSSSSGRNMGLDAGDKISFDDLLYATVCGGYNDASVVLALAVCDTLNDFLQKMNDKASELGMSSTVYLNVTGINANGMTTTVSDIAKLAKYASQNERFVEIASTKYYKLSDSATCSKDSITNRSSLLASYRGLANFNTGSGDFGDNAVLYYKTGDLSFICIVMNANAYDSESTNNYAEIYSKKLLAHAINDYSNKTVLTTKNIISSLPVKYSVKGEEIDIYLKSDLTLFLPDDTDVSTDISYSTYIYGNELEAPLKAGDTVGELVVSYEGKILASVPLEVREDVDKNTFLYVLELMRNYVTGRAFIITVICFVTLMAVHYLLTKRKLDRMYNSRSRRSKRKQLK
ncbi:MAG: D-alanyl-D-alanine carboxypeptidase family protein [Eubacteriales bacterium]